MELKITKKKKLKTIKIVGEISIGEISKIEKALVDILEYTEINIDMTKVTYTNSSFLNIIIMIKDKYPEKRIRILNPNELVMELLTLTGIENLVEIINKP